MSRRIVEGRTFTTYSPYFIIHSIYQTTGSLEHLKLPQHTVDKIGDPAPTETYNTGLYIGCLYLYMRVTN